MFEAANKTEKVSDRIIEQIRDAVLSGQIKPGDRLASEKELIAQFGVSKATMREALRVLEAMGLVEIRKGTTGGVFVAEVDMKTTIHSIMNFLHFRSISISDITMLRFTVEPSVAHLAAMNATEKDLERLRELAEITEADENGDAARDISFHRYLARMSKNPLLILILDFVDNLLRDAKYELQLSPEFYRHVRESHRRIVDFLEARDTVGARAEIARDLLEVDRYMAEAAGSEPFEPATLGLNLDARYVAGPDKDTADDPLAQLLDASLPRQALGRAMVLKHLGSGGLYVVVPEEEEEK
ncbi:MAG: FadR family transcriptional regulator [Desulfarculaceae bacterium]|nr:FadR family transcriptional regulator [Desulfarculaceae bacterium]